MADINVGRGDVSNGVTLNAQNMFVLYGGTANDTIVNEDAFVYVSSGGITNGTILNRGGELDLYSSGTANRTVINSAGYMEAYGKVNGTVISSGGNLAVFSGGTASDTTVKTGGGLYLSPDAKLKGSTVVEQGGWATLDGGYTNAGIDVLGGNLTMSASAGDFCMVDNINVSANGSLTVTNGYATSVTLANAAATIKASGTLSAATLDSASVQLMNGAVLSRATVNDGSIVSATSGARLQHVTINRGGTIAGVLREASQIEFNGGTLALDISGVSPNNAFLVDGVSFTAINTSDNYFCTITVGRSQAYGTYRLVEDASGFDKTITVLDAGGNKLGDLVLGSTSGLNDVDYTLNLDSTSYQLTLTLAAHTLPDTNIPEVKNIKANTTELTNQDVTVTAAFVDDVGIASKQYRIGNGAWTAYTNGVTVSENATVYFKATDTAGNESRIASYEVKNIDKTAPAKPTAKADITAATNQNVTVTATFSNDTATKQYSLDNRTWKTYTTGVVLSSNGSVYFRGKDAAGNISEVASFTVSNIDKTAPAKPVAKADITTATKQNVTVTATFSKDTAKKQYSLNNKDWEKYTSGLVRSYNGTVYFRGIDAAGNISEVASYTISNIDKVAPDMPTAWASTSDPTNDPVTVTATFSKDTAKKQYSLDGSKWQTYKTGVVMKTNGRVYFRGIDAAGNISEVVSCVVSNIRSDLLNISESLGYDGDYEDKFSFTTVHAGMYSITGEFGKLNGTVTVMQGKKTVATEKLKGGMLVSGKSDYMLLDKETEYSIVIKNTDKGKSASRYELNVVAKELFTKGDNSDDWNDVKTRGAAGHVDYLGVVSAPGKLIENEWVGYGDLIDYKGFTINSAAKLSFYATASGAAKVFVCKLNRKGSRNGASYEIKELQGTVLNKTGNSYSASTKPLLLEKGTYYLAIATVSTKNGGSADYNVTVNDWGSEFYAKGDNSDDDWQKGGLQKLKAGDKLTGWVGLGDAIDYREIAVDKNGGFYSFSLSGVENKVRLTVYSKNGDKLKAVKFVTAPGKTLSTGDLCLGKNTKYFLAVEAPGAAKGQNSNYTVTMTGKGTFKNFGNETWENATVLKGGFEGLLTTAAGGDKVDYFDLSYVDKLTLDAVEGKVKVSFYGENRRAIKVAEVKMANGSIKKNVSSLSLVSDNKTTDTIRIGALDDAVKYLKIEAALSSANTYKLSLIA